MKRGKLERHAELRPGPPPTRKQPIKRRPKPLTPHQKAVRAIVLAWANGHCERCGAAFTELWPGEFHHILKRRHQKRDDPNLCRALCHWCHLWTEAEPDQAEAEGYLIRGNGRPLQKGQP